MKKKDFILKDIAGKFILVPIGAEDLDFDGVVVLNETAKFLWENSDNEIDVNDLKDKVIKNFSVTTEEATRVVELFISQMKEADCFE